jgi:acyl-CoA synthetase (AMP-forming)/AMP-acid ligase II
MTTHDMTTHDMTTRAMTTVGAVLGRQAGERGDHPFVVCDDERLTYADAERASHDLARGLVGVGAGRGTHVGILFPTGIDFVTAWLAATRIGAVAVPISTFSTADELGWLLAHADVHVLLTVSAYRGHDYVASLTRALPNADLTAPGPLRCPEAPHLRRVFVSDPGADIDPFHAPDGLRAAAAAVTPELLSAIGADVAPSDRMTIVHTSGSTSAPKAVIHQHGPLLRHLENLNRLRGLSPERRLFSSSPMFWIGGLAYNLVGTLVAGSTLVCSRAEDPARTLDLIERERPDMVNGYAQSVAALVADPSFAARDLSFIRSGNLYGLVADDVRPADVELRHNMLGMTELGSVALMSDDETDQPERYRGSFGRVVPELEARVVDAATGRDCDPGEEGELWFRGPFLMEGYCGRERADVFTPDEWFRTGDVFSVDADGFYYFKGRRDDMIKTGGANVSPREVEAALRDVTGAGVVIVFGIDDPDRGQVVAAAVVGPAEPALDESAVRAALRDRLSAYKVPRRIVHLAPGELPTLSSGKPDLRALAEVLGNG